MSKKELDRVAIMDRIAERRLRQTEAAEMLGLSPRQVGRLFRAYRREGAGALASKKRGRTSNRKHPESLKQRALALVRSHYHDFGPTLAREKLAERHDLDVAVETLRLWMTEAGIWVPRSQRAKRSYQPRERRACFGELVQIDGSKHAWFEDRAEVCALLVYIDDATGTLMELRFARSEATFDYFEATRSYLIRYGKPVAFYSDRHSIFHVNARDKARRGAGLSQFGRALVELNIDIICANSPQAKGRVERANATLQDRLVKEPAWLVSRAWRTPLRCLRHSVWTTIVVSPGCPAASATRTERWPSTRISARSSGCRPSGASPTSSCSTTSG